MNKRNIIILGITIFLVISSIMLYILVFSDNSNKNGQTNLNATSNNLNTSSEVQNNTIPIEGNIINSPYIIPQSLLYRLKLDQNNPKMSYYYSNQNGIALSYENKGINNNKDITVTEGQPDTGDEEKVYLFFTEKDNLQSGQSIEVINIDPNLRFNTIPEIITQQILIADEKVGCKVEEKNGRYSINPKNSTQTCGNYADINNKFFVRPTEDGSAISKLIFVNAGDQELSYDGSMTGKYWYESVIVE